MKTKGGAPIKISGAGVMSVESADLIKTEAFQKQFEALGRIHNKRKKKMPIVDDEIYEVPKHILEINACEKAFIKGLGEEMGYGRIMQLCKEVWGEKLDEEGYSGGEFQIGACVALTVSCGCERGCDWCAGSMWLTKHVKAIKNKNDV